ncbi:MAG: hypothetical protein PHU42_04400 [Patescibacteria group bacterium]|nr:hypothetical protein [Patescibacteria group bacterium]
MSKRLATVVSVVLVMLFFGAVQLKAEEIRGSGFEKIACTDEGHGKSACGDSDVRLDLKNRSFFAEIELVKAFTDNANWLRELMFSRKREWSGSELSVGRLFVGAAYSYPSPKAETVFNPRVPVTFYGWGARFCRTDEAGNEIMVDLTGMTDGPQGFRDGEFQSPEISLRLTHPIHDTSGQISGNVQRSKNFLRLIADGKYAHRDVTIRGAVYHMDERLTSDKVGGYIFAGKEIAAITDETGTSHIEFHLQADYQNDSLKGSSAILTLGFRVFDDEGFSITIDHEVLTNNKDLNAIRFMWLF